MDAAQLYLVHRDAIDESIRYLCAKQRLPSTDAEEFGSEARLHLLKNDGAVMRAFAGRSSLKTYLTVVLGRVFQDWRNARWGKWRPTVAAVRLRPLAVRLETLTARDRHSFDEACEVILTADPDATLGQLRALWEQLPVRSRRSFTSLGKVEHTLSSDTQPDEGLFSRWATETSASISTALMRGVDTLSADDRLLLAMRFEDGLSVLEIARRLRVDPRALYRRLNEILEALRLQLSAAGISQEDAMTALARVGLEHAVLSAPAQRERPTVSGADDVKTTSEAPS